MKKAEVKPDEELTDSVKTLEQITHEWLEQQSFKFEKPKKTSPKKRISDCYVINRFKNTMCKKRGFEDIFSIFGICISKVICSLMKAVKNIIIRSIEFILKIERH